MQTSAIVLAEPRQIALRELALQPKQAGDAVVALDWSSISTGTERLLYTGTMPTFPGMGYPLVPGYESVGRVVAADAAGTLAIGQHVFVPGANCFEGARGLFGGAASQLVVPAHRLLPIGRDLGEKGVLLALAATAYHALGADGAAPDLIVGHGMLGRLLARIAVAIGRRPRRSGKPMPGVVAAAPAMPSCIPTRTAPRLPRHLRRQRRADILDTLIARLAPGGEIVLAGFYSQPLSFAFPPAFMREARLRVAARVETSRSRRRQAARRIRRALARRPDHPSAPTRPTPPAPTRQPSAIPTA